VFLQRASITSEVMACSGHCPGSPTGALRTGRSEIATIAQPARGRADDHPTYRALAELGKAAKTPFLCRYLHAEALRREIHKADVGGGPGTPGHAAGTRHGDMSAHHTLYSADARPAHVPLGLFCRTASYA
jgi:Tn3 transposase DDE domain